MGDIVGLQWLISLVCHCLVPNFLPIKSGDSCFIHEMHNEATLPCHIVRYDVTIYDLRYSGIKTDTAVD